MTQLDGVPVDIDDVTALALVNYGHFTSMRVENQRVRGLSLHMERLRRDCRLLFDAELDLTKVRQRIHQAIGDRAGTFVVRVTVFDPTLELGRPNANAEPRVLVSTRPAGPLPLAPIRVQSVRYARDLPAAKHVGLFGGLWHRREAQRNGFDDALMTDDKGNVCEGITWNIGFFDGDRVIWPESDYLHGVTMELLRRAHPSVIEPVGYAAIAGMQAAFATNTAIGVRAITAIDDVTWESVHPIVENLQKEYDCIPGDPLDLGG